MIKFISRCFVSSLIICLFSCSGSTDSGQANSYPKEILASKTIAITNVNLLAMTSNTIQENQTIVIKNGLIDTIGNSASISTPDDAVLIDAAGKYIMPGLADMHTHLGNINANINDGVNNLRLYMANGVTTVLNMGDFVNEVPQIAELVKNGPLLGPTVYCSFVIYGPLISLQGHVATSPEQGRQLVQLAKTSGYHAIKVYNSLTTETFDAIVDEATTQNLPVFGHGVREPGMSYIISHGMKMVAHAEEFFYTTYNNQIDDSKTPGIISELITNNTYVTATLSTYEGIAKILQANAAGQNAKPYLSVEGYSHLTSARKANWELQHQNKYFQTVDIFPRLTFQKKFVKEFHTAGIKLLLGTDSPGIPGLAPGYSIHEEMRLLSEAGISKYDILTFATKNAGDLINSTVQNSIPFGTIEIGKSADLILLEKNPLDNLTNVKSPAAVITRGHWFSRDRLNELI